MPGMRNIIEEGDSLSLFVRIIERWKRGVLALLILALVGLLVATAVGGAALAAEMFGWGYRGLIMEATALIIGPWLLGKRYVLRLIGEIATLPDD